jgi:carboxypeptidase PM20D1
LRIVKAIAFAAVAILLVLGGIVAVRTMQVATPAPPVSRAAHVAVDHERVAELLAGAIRFRTLSTQDPKDFDAQPFVAFHEYLERNFPAVHETLKRESVAGYSLLYTWEGSHPSLAPIVLMAHQDVVPVAAETENKWSVPAFEGRIADGYVWGRGALDDKGSLIAIMAAAEELATHGFRPRRTVYLAFGHDEEVMSTGAPATAELLQSRGVAPEFVLDEGGSIVEGMITGVDAPVAMVGVAEKGYMTVELTAKGEGGHSSMPPRHTAAGILSRVIARLENNPFPTRFAGPTEEMLNHLAPAARMPLRAVFANTWLFAPIITWQLAREPSTDATIRTTTAATMLSAGVKENVLPTEARAVVNFRIMPGDTVDTVTNHVRAAIGSDPVSIKVLSARGPTAVAGTDTAGFTAIENSVREVYPEVAAVVPFLTLGGTDSRYYGIITSDIYRFLPAIMRPEDLGRIHGIDERIAVEQLGRGVKFYVQLIRNAAQ